MKKIISLIIIFLVSCSPIKYGKRNMGIEEVNKKIDKKIEKGYNYQERFQKRHNKPLK